MIYTAALRRKQIKISDKEARSLMQTSAELSIDAEQYLPNCLSSFAF